MTNLASWLGTLLDLLLVVLGFGAIIFIHELGHFLAAKWAGIRVLAFAIGFGPAAFSWRKGLGFRRGSSEREYTEMLRARVAGHDTKGVDVNQVSPTEYRLNYLPLGGYVKMLGQDDLNPAAVSSASDSYQRCPVWKRMVVISAGVVMNVIAAAVLFIAVFMTGLKTEPPVVGYVVPGMPASQAVPAAGSGITEPGLRSGDVITRINGRRPNSFNDLVMASAMSRKNEPMRVEVERAGTPVAFEIRPKASQQSRLLEIGVMPAFSATVVSAKTDKADEEIRKALAQLGLAQVEPGMRLVRVGSDTDVTSAADLTAAVQQSGGNPVEAEFEDPATGQRVAATITPQAALQSGRVTLSEGSQTSVSHLLGLTPVMRVSTAADAQAKQGLQRGDIFARIGSVEYPSIAQGIAEIRRHKGQPIKVTVLRPGEGGELERVQIEPDPVVSREGTIGFGPDDTADEAVLLALPPEGLIDDKRGEPTGPLPAASVIDRPGTRVVSVVDTPVANFTELRAALREATRAEYAAGEGAQVFLTLEPPLPEQPGGIRPQGDAALVLSKADVAALHELGWTSPVPLGVFELVEFTLRAKGDNFLARSGDAVRMGLSETQRVMLMTYATFARLVEGTVKVEHLKGPIGIAHLGTRIAERGVIWLLFFMALISVNLAVINFLPLPIVDGGQFLFLVLERIRGRPLSVEIQNMATIAGLLLIGTMFIIVTFNDLMTLFTG